MKSKVISDKSKYCLICGVGLDNLDDALLKLSYINKI